MGEADKLREQVQFCNSDSYFKLIVRFLLLIDQVVIAAIATTVSRTSLKYRGNVIDVIPSDYDFASGKYFTPSSGKLVDLLTEHNDAVGCSSTDQSYGY